MSDAGRKAVVLGVEIDKLTMGEVLEKVHEAILSKSALGVKSSWKCAAGAGAWN